MQTFAFIFLNLNSKRNLTTHLIEQNQKWLLNKQQYKTLQKP
jgi:hypothetical protein